MIKHDKQIILNTKKYNDFDELQEVLFWKDLYLYELDTLYIHDANQNNWYSIELKYNYADILQLFDEGKKIIFDEVKDNELTSELEDIFLQE